MAPSRERFAPERERETPRRGPAAPRPQTVHEPRRGFPRPGRPSLAGLAHAVLPRQSWIDRIVGGRAWIPLFGALLVAIVGMRVEVLKLSSRVGTQIEQASALQSSNAVLRSTVSELSGNERIEALAERLGMVMPGPMDIQFVPGADGSHLLAAMRNIKPAEPTSFLTGLAAERQADLASMQRAAQTSAVGVLAGSVINYSQAVSGAVTSDPLAGPVGSGSQAGGSSGSSGSAGATTGTGALGGGATGTAGAGTASQANAATGATGTAGAAGTTGPSGTVSQPAGTGTASSSGSGTTGSGAGTATGTTGAGAGAAGSTSGAASSTVSSPNSQSTSPPTSSGTATVTGGPSGSANGGTSLGG